MKILLIQPCSDSQRWKGKKSHFGWPPLGLAYVAASTPREHEVTLIDEAVEPIGFDTPADLIGIGIMTANSLRGYEIARKFKERGKTVVLGGIHASMIPQEAKIHADSVVIGEAEGTWEQVLDDFSSASLKEYYRSERPPDIWNAPMPRRELFRKGAYKIPATVMATRGCPHGCSFCSTSRYFGRKYRKRNPELVAGEVASLKERLILFVDDNLFFDRQYSLEFLKLIGPLKKKWVCQATVDIADDEELLDSMRRAGCMGVLVGIESLNPHNISAVGKGVNKVSEYRRRIEAIHRMGISVQGSFIFGFDQDDTRAFEPVLDLVFTAPLETANFCVLTPLPGTSVFEKLEKEGRLLHRDWASYDRLNVTYAPLMMTPEELQHGVIDCYLRTYSYGGIVKRMPWLSKRLPLTLALNLSYRKGAYGQWK